MKLKPVILLMTIPGLIIMLCAGGWADVSSEDATGSRLDQADQARAQRLLQTVAEFRQGFLGDYRNALEQYATPEAIKKIEELDKHIWVESTPKIGWSYFVTVSPNVFGGIKGGQPIVAFYNPWADVFLLTVWEIRNGTYRMVDAEVLMGDWLRDKKIPDPMPHWLRGRLFRPTELGLSVATSIQNFEKKFSGDAITDWRKRLTVLSNEEVLRGVNYPLAAMALLNNLRVIDEFRHSTEGENPRVTSARNCTLAFLKRAASGRIDQLIKTARETIPDQKELLAKISADWFKHLAAVGILVSDKATLVFLSPIYSPGGCLSLLFKGKPESQKLARIDFVYYQGIYQYGLDHNESGNMEASR